MAFPREGSGANDPAVAVRDGDTRRRTQILGERIAATGLKYTDVIAGGAVVAAGAALALATFALPS